jgi:hypothetical protein
MRIFHLLEAGKGEREKNMQIRRGFKVKYGRKKN